MPPFMYGYMTRYYLQRGSTDTVPVLDEEAWCVVGETWQLGKFASDDVLVSTAVVAFYRNYPDAENARCDLQRRNV